MSIHDVAICAGICLIAFGVQGWVLRTILHDVVAKYAQDILDPALQQMLQVQEDTRDFIAQQRTERRASLQSLKDKYQAPLRTVTMNEQNQDGSLTARVDNPMSPRGLRQPLDLSQVEEIESKLKGMY